MIRLATTYYFFPGRESEAPVSARRVFGAFRTAGAVAFCIAAVQRTASQDGYFVAPEAVQKPSAFVHSAESVRAISVQYARS
jgi:hypothetical protein